MIVRRMAVEQRPYGPGVIGDFTKIGEADMTVEHELLTTSDPTQTDALLPGGPGFPPPALMFALDPAFTVWPVYEAVDGRPRSAPTHWPTLYTVPDTSDVAGHVGSGGTDIHGTTGVSGNEVGDMLVVLNSGAFISDASAYKTFGPLVYGPWGANIPSNIAQDTYLWDGSSRVLAAHWVGPSPVTAAWFDANQGDPANWEFIPMQRAAPADPGLYVYQWTKPGQFAEGYKFRARLRLAPASYESGVIPAGQPFAQNVNAGIIMCLTDEDDGLMWCLAGAGDNSSGFTAGGTSGWTKKPSDLEMWGDHAPPERVQSDGTYCYMGEHPLGGTVYADLGAGETELGREFDDIHSATQWSGVAYYLLHPGSTGDIWVEVWRQANTAFAAIYLEDPRANPPAYVSRFAEDLSGGPYADGTAGYFGFAFSWLNPYAGLRDCEIVPVTSIPAFDTFGISDSAAWGYRRGTADSFTVSDAAHA